MQLLKSRRRHQRQQRQLHQQNRQQRQRQHRRQLQDSCKAKKVAQSRRRFRSLLLLLRSECGNRCRSKRYARTHLCMYACTRMHHTHTHTLSGTHTQSGTRPNGRCLTRSLFTELNDEVDEKKRVFDCTENNFCDSLLHVNKNTFCKNSILLFLANLLIKLVLLQTSILDILKI